MGARYAILQTVDESPPRAYNQFGHSRVNKTVKPVESQARSFEVKSLIIKVLLYAGYFQLNMRYDNFFIFRNQRKFLNAFENG